MARTAERVWWRTADEDAALRAAGVGIYLNRLSDYLFVLARTLSTNERLWGADPSIRRRGGASSSAASLRPVQRVRVLPGSRAAHMVRTAERVWWRAADEDAALRAAGVGIYLNRLSDYLFVLARTLATNERLWVPIRR